MRKRNIPYSKIANHFKICEKTAREIVRNYKENRQLGRRKGLWANRSAVYNVRHTIDSALKSNQFLKGKELQEIVYQKTGECL